MTAEGAIALLFLSTLLVANCVATRIVLRDQYTEQRQKVVQITTVWLIPLFGVIFVFALHRKPEKASGTYREIPPHPDD